MASDASITFWIDLLKAGDQQAAQPLWERYFGRLVGLAQKKLQGASRAAADEEDVALSAFKSFCLAAEQGRFPRLNDRDDLWRLLVVLTERKAFNQARDEKRLKRGGGQVLNETALDADEATRQLEQAPGREPTPDLAAQVAEQCRILLAKLDDDLLRELAVLKMEGYANEEIAAQKGIALRSVERKLGLIRKVWQQEIAE